MRDADIGSDGGGTTVFAPCSQVMLANYCNSGRTTDRFLQIPCHNIQMRGNFIAANSDKENGAEGDSISAFAPRESCNKMPELSIAHLNR